MTPAALIHTRFRASCLSFWLPPAALALLALILPSVPRLAVASDLPTASDGAFRPGATPLAVPTPSSAPPTATDIQFVNGTGGDLDQYLYRRDLTSTNGTMQFTIPITRCYGSKYDYSGVNRIQYDANGFIDNWSDVVYVYHLIPPTATLYLRVFDIDWGCGDLPPPACEPRECDLVYINGHFVSFMNHPTGVLSQCDLHHLPGEHGKWTVATASISTQWLKFPQTPGTGSTLPTPATNIVTIEIDHLADPQNQWAMACDWGAIGIPEQNGLPVRPCLLIHGLNASSNPTDTWLDFGGKTDAYFRDYGIPFELPDPETGTTKPWDAWSAGIQGWGSIFHNAPYVGDAIEKIKTTYGVDHVNLIVHSKGGLDSRVSVFTRSDVDNLIELATPNYGSQVADHVVGFLSLFGVNYAALPALFDLQESFMLILNFFGPYGPNANVHYSTMAAIGNGVSYLGLLIPNDTVVYVNNVSLPWLNPLSPFVPPLVAYLPPPNNLGLPYVDRAYGGSNHAWYHSTIHVDVGAFKWSINQIVYNLNPVNPLPFPTDPPPPDLIAELVQPARMVPDPRRGGAGASNPVQTIAAFEANLPGGGRFCPEVG